MADMKRAKQIRENVGIEQVLYDLGYPIQAGIEREQQFPCDLHGDGKDGKYSARVYPDSGSWYCFACGKSRDAIETYRDKFGYSFGKACWTIESKYGLPHIFSNGKDNEEKDVPKVDHSESTFKIMQRRVETILKGVGKVKSMEDSLRWWEAYDYICWAVSENQWNFEQGYNRLSLMLDKIKGKNDAEQGVTESKN